MACAPTCGDTQQQQQQQQQQRKWQVENMLLVLYIS
jgi:hypothetical protein